MACFDYPSGHRRTCFSRVVLKKCRRASAARVGKVTVDALDKKCGNPAHSYPLEFEWHDAKSAINLSRHSVDSGDAIRAFLDPLRLELEDSRCDYGESMKGVCIMKVRLDRDSSLAGKTDWAKLKARSPREALAAAQADAVNPPLTDNELARMQPVPDSRAIREKLGLSQREFAEAFHLSLATIRDWDQGRYQLDQAARTLLRLIAREPKLVEKALR